MAPKNWYSRRYSPVLSVDAELKVLNHIGGRFPVPRQRETIRQDIIAEIERQASEAWGLGSARVSWDYMTVGIPAPESLGETRSSYARRHRQLDGDMLADPVGSSSNTGHSHHSTGRKRRRG